MLINQIETELDNHNDALDSMASNFLLYQYIYIEISRHEEIRVFFSRPLTHLIYLILIRYEWLVYMPCLQNHRSNAKFSWHNQWQWIRRLCCNVFQEHVAAIQYPILMPHSIVIFTYSSIASFLLTPQNKQLETHLKW